MIKRTQPRQAASRQSLDRWERELRVIVTRLTRLLASLQRAERR